MTQMTTPILSENMPDMLAIFPLHGVLLLPGGQLPLNIFEPRYLAMVDEALRTNRLIGIIQPRIENEEELYTTGCAGKIVSFTETPDGRYEITLKGISRFDLSEELPVHTKNFRSVTPDWASYESDLNIDPSCLGLDRNKLKSLLKQYFAQQEMECDWSAIDEAPDGKLMTCLSMTCPFEPAEKQALLEEKCCKKRAQMFITMMEMELYKPTQA